MALLKIRTFKDAILRKKCKQVTAVDDKVRVLLNDMVETMHNTQNGAGLAACQVGILRRLVVIDLGDGVIKLVNPKIIYSEGEQFEFEGCLSFPGIWGRVHRPEKVIVSALNENGDEITIQGAGFMAKCLCHEIDHLDGIVFVDVASELIKN